MKKSQNKTDYIRKQNLENLCIYLDKRVFKFDSKNDVEISLGSNGIYYARKGDYIFPLQEEHLKMFGLDWKKIQHLVPESHLEREAKSSFLKKLFFGEKSRIKKPPASFLLKFADLLPKKYSENLKQEVSDLRLEYTEALSEKKIWRARFIASFYYIGLSWAVMMCISEKVKKVIEVVPKKN
jgi:hypothetical protein